MGLELNPKKIAISGLLILFVVWIIFIRTQYQYTVSLILIAYTIILISYFSRIRLWKQLLPNIIGGLISGFIILLTYNQEGKLRPDIILTIAVVIVGLIAIYLAHYDRNRV